MISHNMLASKLSPISTLRVYLSVFITRDGHIMLLLCYALMFQVSTCYNFLPVMLSRPPNAPIMLWIKKRYKNISNECYCMNN